MKPTVKLTGEQAELLLCDMHVGMRTFWSDPIVQAVLAERDRLVASGVGVPSATMTALEMVRATTN